MTLATYKLIAAICIFLISIATVVLPIRKHTEPHTDSLELGEAFASGIFLGAAFFHMLPEALKIFNQLYGSVRFPMPEAICVAGFLLLLFLERLSGLKAGEKSQKAIPYLLALILIIHSLTEGAALGIGSNISEAIMLFIAIAAHKGSASFALCVTMQRHHLPLKQIIAIIIIFSLMTPLGIFAGAAVNFFSYVQNDRLVEAIFNAFAAGTFLYMSTLHHPHFHRHSSGLQGLYEFGSLFAGLVMMALISIWG